MQKIAEYEALRSTIRDRGSVRICAILAGVIAWGALLLALNAHEFERAAMLIPLLVLATTFEISFFIHTGVERVGRYLQVYHEDEGDWEHVVMRYGKNYPGGADALFVTLFAILTAADFLGSLPSAARHVGWIPISLLAHLAFGWRLFGARRLSAGQRAVDLERFRALKNDPSSK
jgi:hypothetical protein